MILVFDEFIAQAFIRGNTLPQVNTQARITAARFLNYERRFHFDPNPERSFLAEAQQAGVSTLNYGNFIQTVVDFVIIAFSVFMMVKTINRVRKKEEAKPAEPPKPSAEVVLLQEIRDALIRRCAPV